MTTRTYVLSDEVYRKIKELIICYEISPGSKVNIDALSVLLKVSQTPIREALARLESDGLIMKVPLKGYSATPLLTVKEFHDLFQLRLLLEPWAAGQAAKVINSHGRKALDTEMLKTKKSLKVRHMDEFRILTEHDARFHTLVSELSGNDSVKAAFERTHCHLHLFRNFMANKFQLIEMGAKSVSVQNLFEQYYQNGSGQLAIIEHDVIAQAIIEGDSKAARLGMHSHIQSSLRRISTTDK